MIKKSTFNWLMLFNVALFAFFPLLLTFLPPFETFASIMGITIIISFLPELNLVERNASAKTVTERPAEETQPTVENSIRKTQAILAQNQVKELPTVADANTQIVRPTEQVKAVNKIPAAAANEEASPAASLGM